jgi:hypothetical protein
MIKAYTIPSKTKKEEYSVILNIDDLGNIIPEKSSCTCPHGSCYRFTKLNLSLNNWKCSHMDVAIQKFKNKEPDNIETERRKNGHTEEKQTKEKAIYPIF